MSPINFIELVSLGVLIPLTIGGIRFKRLPQQSKVLYFSLIISTIFTELFHFIPRQMMLLSILQHAVELVCFGYVYKGFFVGAKMPKIILDLALILLIVDAVYTISLSGYGIHPVTSMSLIPAITLIILSLYYFITTFVYRILNDGETGQQYLSWFALATLFHFFPYILYHFPFRINGEEVSYRLILVVFGSISFLLFGLYFLFAKEEDFKGRAYLTKFLSGPFTRWTVHVKDIKFSSEEFYNSIEKRIAEYGIPDIKHKKVKFYTGGILSAQRVYLRISRKRLTYDICAAPFGNQFFVSSWFGTNSPFIFEIPLIGKILEWWLASRTYYQHDSNSIFMQTISECVKESLDEMMGKEGITRLSEEQLKTIQTRKL